MPNPVGRPPSTLSIREKIKLRSSIVDRGYKTKCYEWGGGIFSDGYGALRVGKKTCKVHRLSYKEFKGNIPKGKLVCHYCDNPVCWRPTHLFLGTHQDNVDDMFSKGRGFRASGIHNGTAKLTPTCVRKIRKSSASAEFLAKRYRVSQACILKVRKFKTWKHVR